MCACLEGMNVRLFTRNGLWLYSWNKIGVQHMQVKYLSSFEGETCQLSQASESFWNGHGYFEPMMCEPIMCV